MNCAPTFQCFNAVTVVVVPALEPSMSGAVCGVVGKACLSPQGEFRRRRKPYREMVRGLSFLFPSFLLDKQRKEAARPCGNGLSAPYQGANIKKIFHQDRYICREEE
jgi:hypothetical protein